MTTLNIRPLILLSINSLISAAVSSTATCPRTIHTIFTNDSYNNIRWIFISEQINDKLCLVNTILNAIIIIANDKLVSTVYTCSSLKSNPTNGLCGYSHSIIQCTCFSIFLGNLKSTGRDTGSKRSHPIFICIGVERVKNRWILLE